MSKKPLGLKIKLTFTFIFFVAFGTITIATFILFTASGVYVEQTESKLENMALNKAAYFQEKINNVISLTKSVGRVYHSVKDLDEPMRRPVLSDILKKSFETRSDLIAFSQWTILPPGIIDHRDEKNKPTEFEKYYHMMFQSWKGQLDINPKIDYNAYESGEWWDVPLKTKKMFFTEPYLWDYKGNIGTLFVASLCEPLLDNGKFIGLSGHDLNLTNFQSEIEKIKPFEGTYSYLATAKGTVVAYQNEWIGKSLGEAIPMYKDSRQQVGKILKVDGYWHVSAPLNFNLDGEPWVLTIAVPENEIMAPFWKMLYISITIFLVIIAIVIAISIFLASRITNPIITISEILKKVSRGDLNVNFELNQNDEIGILAHSVKDMTTSLKQKVELARRISDGDLSGDTVLASEKDVLGQALKSMTDNLNTIIKKITNGSVTLSDSVDELSTVSSQILGNTKDMADQSNTMAGASTEMNSNVETLAAGAQERSANISSISATSTQMSQSVAEILKSLTGLSETINIVSDKSKNAYDVTIQAKEMSDSATAIMNQLSSSASEINEVTELIKAIAQQTNLLALNANIEAASAGEAGKGFAVVANEIKDLAQQSSSSAEAIANKIMDIQKSSEQSSTSMEQISKIITTINDSSSDITNYVTDGSETVNIIVQNMKESNSGIADIAKMIDEMSNMVDESAKTTAELSKGTNDIARNMNRFDESVSKTASGITQVSNQTENLNSLAHELQDIVKEFKLKD